MMRWKGVMPAMTTCFDQELQVDHSFMRQHAELLVNSGCTGLVMLGSLGEGAALDPREKRSILRNMVEAAGRRVPIIAAISALTTAEAVRLAQNARETGCTGLMVLPPYIYKGDWRETKTYISSVLRSTPLSAMLYNNPVAYGTDFLPEQIAELAEEHENLHAVKESSTDVRRVSAIRALTGDRLSIFVGVDDAIVEGVAAGASGWIAGLVNAFPVESVALFDFATADQRREAFDLYRWFLPLLRMDTVPKFVQLIKFVQAEVGLGNMRVRPPRLELAGDEREHARGILQHALRTRPVLTGELHTEQIL
ncbi:MAG TPA: dihydrodipicolinate synthase family protein [Acidobacteriaceae bacterium]|nr:dihydrodipicolinate synthase family protein [Acidobacteriaceae bacterium]